MQPPVFKKALSPRRLALYALFTSLALGLSLLERYVPLSLLLPLPGVKLGLSNLVTLAALDLFGLPAAALIQLSRILLASVFSGSITSLAYALLGGILSLLSMAISGKTGLFSAYGISILGSAMHSLGQILAAALLLGSPSVFSYLPVLWAVSILTGALIALLFQRLRPALQRACARFCPP